MNLTTRLQTQEHLNRQLEERLAHQSIQTQPESQVRKHDNEFVQRLFEVIDCLDLFQ